MKSFWQCSLDYFIGNNIELHKNLLCIDQLIGIGWGDGDKSDEKSFCEAKSGDVVLVKCGITWNPGIALVLLDGDYSPEYNPIISTKIKEKFSYVRKIKVLAWYDNNVAKLRSKTDNFSHGKTFSGFSTDWRQKFVEDWYKKTMENGVSKEIIALIKQKKNLILTGAPGTGKTYITAELAMKMIEPEKDYSSRSSIMKAYRQKIEEGRIVFTTFHQTMDYEEFVEGLRPDLADSDCNSMKYEPRPGIFKSICEKAGSSRETNKLDEAIEKLKDEASRNNITIETIRGIPFNLTYRDGITFRVRSHQSNADKGVDFPVNIDNIRRFYTTQQRGYNQSYIYAIVKYLQKENAIPDFSGYTSNKPYILIIDEINRGNISKILGELITLLEKDKRVGELNELSVTLPYSLDTFTIPSNLYIIGTMNTADRSLGRIDYAIRRRFAFYSLKADKQIIERFYSNSNSAVKNVACNLFDKIRDEIICDKILNPEFSADDMMIGHSYFMANNLDELRDKLEYEIKPLLREYLCDGILRDGKDEIEALSI